MNKGMIQEGLKTTFYKTNSARNQQKSTLFAEITSRVHMNYTPF